MIKAKNIIKSFNDQIVLNNVSLNLPDKGLISVVGKSGCGKSTLLNVLSGLLKSDGEVIIDKINLATLTDNELSSFRLNEIGFIYQDYKLFEHETIEENVLLPFSTTFHVSKEEKKRYLVETLEVVELNKDIKTPVYSLSGGEKQRVAIARAIINSPKILFCDEPTGALDKDSKRQIMKILEKISNKCLVVVVSHNLELVDEFADEIIYLSNGRIYKHKINNNIKEKANILLKKKPKFKKKEKLPLKFIISEIFQNIKIKKFRSSISLFTMSLGLVSLGFSLVLTSSVSSNIKKTFASVIDENRIILSQRETTKQNSTKFAATLDETNKIAEQYKEYIDYVGFNYLASYEDFFKTTDELCLEESSHKLKIEGISSRCINEFRYLNFHEQTFYPYKYETIKNSEIILGLTIDMINSICYELRIERSVESLSKYLENEEVDLSFYLENLSWHFSFNFPLKMVGFSLENRCSIYHTNPNWNNYIFEEVMRFPISENISGVLSKPWTLRKIPFLQIKEEKIDEFLSISLKEKELISYIFEIGNISYFPNKNLNPNNRYNYRLQILKNTLLGISPIYSPHLIKTYKNLTKPIFVSYGGYFIYPEIMMAGFANTSFVSNDISILEEVIDKETSLNLENNEVQSLPKGVLSAHYVDSMDNGISFSPLEKERQLSYKEIIISSNLSHELFNKLEPIGQSLFISTLVSESLNNSGQIYKEFKTVELKIVDVITDKRNAIFHNSDWSINYFISNLEMSRFALDCSSISFEVINESKKEIINKINSRDSPYSFLIANDPMENFSLGVDEVCSFLEIALLFFSSITIVVSILLLSMSNYLFLIENKKQIGLLRCIGISSFEARKLLICNSLIYGTLAFIISSFELLLTSIFINLETSIILGGELFISFNPISLLVIFIVSISISLVSSVLISSKLASFSPLESLKS